LFEHVLRLGRPLSAPHQRAPIQRRPGVDLPRRVKDRYPGSSRRKRAHEGHQNSTLAGLPRPGGTDHFFTNVISVTRSVSRSATHARCGR
jgi:hypothetical protein